MNSKCYLAFVVGVMFNAVCAQAQDSGDTDTLRWNCFSVFPAGLDSFGIPIYIHSDEPLYALSVVYCYESSKLAFSSARLGDRLAAVSTSSLAVINRPAEKAFVLAWVDIQEHPILPSGETWLFATIYFKNELHWPCPDDLELRACSLPPGLVTTFTPADGNEFSPVIWEWSWPDACPLILCMDAGEDGFSLINSESQLKIGPHPNPFNSGTVLEISTFKSGSLAIEIYDILGRRVRTLVDSDFPAGEYSFAWDGTDEGYRQVASGVYLARVFASEFHSSRKLVLLR